MAYKNKAMKKKVGLKRKAAAPARARKVKEKKEPVGPIAVNIGERIKTIRGKDLKQEALATAAKISRNIVSNIEQGHNYTIKQLIKVLDALGANIDDVIQIEKMLAGDKEALRRVSELLHAGPPWNFSITTYINSMYSSYKSEKPPDA